MTAFQVLVSRRIPFEANSVDPCPSDSTSRIWRTPSVKQIIVKPATSELLVALLGRSVGTDHTRTFSQNFQ